MFDISDKTTYLGLPIDPTDPSPNPSSHDLASPDGKNKAKFQPPLRDDTAWCITSIVGGAVIAVGLAVGHHAFLDYLNGRNVAEFSQLWIKGADNGFSNGFSICLGLSAAAALTQMKWRVSGSEPLPMYTIDHLFALPAPLMLLKTLMRPRRSLFLPILSSVLIQALVFVSILAPSALTIAPSEPVSRDMQVSTLNVSSLEGQFIANTIVSLEPVEITISSLPKVLLSLDTSAAGKQKINNLILNLPEVPWIIPSGCGLKCAFHFKYEAPILECHDVILDDYHDPHYDIYLYQSSTSISPQHDLLQGGNTTAPSERSRLLDVPYDLSINYTIYDPNSGSRIYPRAGTYCRFRWGTYNASYELGNDFQRLNTSIISYSDNYLSLSDAFVNNSDSDRYPEFTGTWAICHAFVDAFQTNVTDVVLQFETSSISPILQTIFDFSYQGDSIFEPAVPNLSQTLVDMFSNLTLGLIPTETTGNHTITVNAAVWDGTSVWIYTAWILWAAYLPALTLALPVILYGLSAIQMNGIGMGDEFSSFLLATRNEELDDICKESTGFEELRRFRLIYRKRGTFNVDSGLKYPI